MSDQKEDRWTMLETPPEGVKETAALYSWSLNYDAGKGPFTAFLDLIGWSEENIGEPLYPWTEPRLGYLELDYLADALKEYTTAPREVEAWVESILEAEGAE